MKKTLLILLTSVSFLSISACYSTPEMNELRSRIDYENAEGGCNTQADYQHEGLRNCIESRMAYDDENKKTVTIVPTKKGSLVIPRSYDDEAMMDVSRIYERVDINDDTVVIEEGFAPKKALVKETTTIIETSKVREEVTNEKVENESFEEESIAVEKDVPAEDISDEVVEEEVVDEPEEEKVEAEPEKAEVEPKEDIEEAEVESKKETPNVVLNVETKPEPKREPLAVVDGVKEASSIVINEVEEEPAVRTETVIETEIIAPPETRIKAEILAEPESIIEIEKKTGDDVEVKKTVTVTKKETVKEAVETKKPVKEPVESKKAPQKADSSVEQTVTLVVMPDADDVVVSLGLAEPVDAEAQKPEIKTVQTTKTTTVTTEKEEKIKTFKKNEKEVLPIEEK